MLGSGIVWLIVYWGRHEKPNHSLDPIWDRMQYLLRTEQRLPAHELDRRNIFLVHHKRNAKHPPRWIRQRVLTVSQAGSFVQNSIRTNPAPWSKEGCAPILSPPSCQSDPNHTNHEGQRARLGDRTTHPSSNPSGLIPLLAMVSPSADTATGSVKVHPVKSSPESSSRSSRLTIPFCRVHMNPSSPRSVCPRPAITSPSSSVGSASLSRLPPCRSPRPTQWRKRKEREHPEVISPLFDIVQTQP